MYRLYQRPQDRLKDSLLWRLGKNYGHEFWALSNVSFELRRGEAIGIIGRNGGGKSTLLQIIAGVLQPTAGEVEVKGRAAAILELGSGFNPEFTGRENVYLNGSIMGMPRKMVDERFDEIAAFADIGEFIDQPVKLYSSGMFVRLAFAVSTSVDADALVIDEALAVGDVFFRQKCYRRLETLRERGVAIVLVSHAMTEVEQFCERALLLHEGEVVFLGPATEAVERYYLLEQDESSQAKWQVGSGVSLPTELSAGSPSSGLAWPTPNAFLDLSRASEVGVGGARITGVALCDRNDRPRAHFGQGEVARFYFEFEALRDLDVPVGGVQLRSDRGVIVHGKTTLELGTSVPLRVPRGTRLRFCQEIALELAVGEYTFDIGLAELPPAAYQERDRLPHAELARQLSREAQVLGVGVLSVGFRQRGQPVQLLHHGVANLPGVCRVATHVPGLLPVVL